MRSQPPEFADDSPHMVVPAGIDDAQLVYESDRTKVYLAHRHSLPVVVKALSDPTHGREALRSEFDLLRRFDSQYFVKPRELIDEPDACALIFPHDDPSVRPLDMRCPMSIEEFLTVAPAIVRALAEVHSYGVIHKDIKPANIIIPPDLSHALLIDFGIASFAVSGANDETTTEDLQGSLHYIAPEQTGRMNRTVDYRADLYSLGATFYEMLSGEPPFVADDPMELIHAHIAKAPAPLGTKVTNLPAPCEAIIARLLSKSPDARYQGCTGLKYDLEQCRDRFDGTDIEEFELGEHDIGEHFEPPTELYGSEDHVERLLELYRHTLNGELQVVTVRGPTGIGKTRLVSELQRHLGPTNGRFAVGAFEQHNRNVPYSAITVILEALLDQLSTAGAEEISGWKQRILKAVGENGALLTTLVPHFEWLLGEQPPVSDASANEAQVRLNTTLGRTLLAFADKQQPLVLLVDNMQWVDPPTIALIRYINQEAKDQPMMLVGAYRDTEIDAKSRLTSLLDELRKGPRPFHEIELGPMIESTVSALVRDMLSAAPGHEHLSEVLYSRTNGNPFFLTQVLAAIHADRLMRFDPDKSHWVWDIAGIESMSAHESAVDLLLDNFSKLSPTTKELLGVAACLGAHLNLANLAKATDQTPAETASALGPALEGGFIIATAPAPAADKGPNERSTETVQYRFAHDRLSEVAESMLGPQRAAAHLKIVQLLLELSPHGEQSSDLLVIADHVNQGIELVAGEDRPKYAELNLNAGRRAMSSAAFDAALNYLENARRLLGANAWASHPQLTYEIDRLRGESLYVTGERDKAEEVLNAALDQVNEPLKWATLIKIRVVQLTNRGEYEEACKLYVAGLNELGVKINLRPPKVKALGKLLALRIALRGQTFEQLTSLPELSDPRAQILSELLLAGIACAYQAKNETLFLYATLLLVSTALEYGVNPRMGYAFVALGVMHTILLQDFARGDLYARVGLEITRPNAAARCQAGYAYGGLMKHWTANTRISYRQCRQAFEDGMNSGELVYAGYAAIAMGQHLLWAAVPLNTITDQAVESIEFFRRTGDPMIATFLAFVKWLKVFAGEEGELHVSDLRTAEDTETVSPVTRCMLGQIALNAGYLDQREDLLAFGWDETKAVEVHSRGPIAGRTSMLVRALASCDRYALGIEPKKMRADVQTALRKLRSWAKQCPEVHLPCLQMVRGNWAFATGKHRAALNDLIPAIDGFQNNTLLKGITEEIAARVYLAREEKQLAQALLEEAVKTFDGWGAKSKVKQLKTKYAKHLGSVPAIGAATSVGATAMRPTTTSTAHATSMGGGFGSLLDLETVLKTSQTLAQEVVVDKLMDKLSRIVLENAGGQRAAIWAPSKTGWQVRALGEVDGDDVRVEVNPSQTDTLPAVAVNYVERKKETLLVGDAQSEKPWSDAQEIKSAGVRSILCVPVVRQDRLKAVLYVDHRDVSNCFTQARGRLLQTLGSQIAISLENAELYDNLEHKVTERTEALRQVTENLQAILDHVTFGFLTIGPDLIIRGGHTKSCLELLGRNRIAKQDLRDALGLTTEDQRVFFQISSEQFFDDFMPEDLLVDQFPSRVERDGRVLNVRPSSIRNEHGQVVSILFSITDITELEAAQKENHTNHALLEILRSKPAFISFLDDARRQLDAAIDCINDGDQTVTRRIVHTIKGNSGCFGMEDVANFIHHIESNDELSVENIHAIRATLEAYLDTHHEVLGVKFDGNGKHEVAVPPGALSQLEQLAKVVDRTSAATLRNWVTHYRSPTVADLLGPVGQLLGNLATRLGKEVQFDLVGGDTRVDAGRLRPVLQNMIHLLRNCVDHGVETPEERGDKNPRATIALRATRTDEAVNLTVEDDGRGIAVEKVCLRAIDKGILDESTLKTMTEQDKLQLVFADNVSTAEAVSDISGRGVGMSAIKQQVEQLGGKIHIETVTGRGTKIELRLPTPEVGSGNPPRRAVGAC